MSVNGILFSALRLDTPSASIPKDCKKNLHQRFCSKHPGRIGPFRSQPCSMTCGPRRVARPTDAKAGPGGPRAKAARPGEHHPGLMAVLSVGKSPVMALRLGPVDGRTEKTLCFLRARLAGPKNRARVGPNSGRTINLSKHRPSNQTKEAMIVAGAWQCIELPSWQ